MEPVLGTLLRQFWDPEIGGWFPVGFGVGFLQFWGSRDLSFSSLILIFSWFCAHHLMNCRMSICQTVIALSANFEVAGGVIFRPPASAPFYVFLWSTVRSLLTLTVDLAEQSSGFRQLWVCLFATRTSFSSAEMKLFYEVRCLAAQIPDPRGTFSMRIYSTISLGLPQNLGSGRVLSGICITFSQNGLQDQMNFMSCALGITCIIISWDMNVRRDCFLWFCVCNNGRMEILFLRSAGGSGGPGDLVAGDLGSDQGSWAILRCFFWSFQGRTFHCAHQPKLIRTVWKPRSWKSHVQDM